MQFERQIFCQQIKYTIQSIRSVQSISQFKCNIRRKLRSSYAVAI